jgi:hypothetical protein
VGQEGRETIMRLLATLMALAVAPQLTAGWNAASVWGIETNSTCANEQLLRCGTLPAGPSPASLPASIQPAVSLATSARAVVTSVVRACVGTTRT